MGAKNGSLGVRSQIQHQSKDFDSWSALYLPACELDVVHPPYGWSVRTVIEHCCTPSESLAIGRCAILLMAGSRPRTGLSSPYTVSSQWRIFLHHCLAFS